MDIRSFLEMTTFMSNLVKSSDSIHSRVAFCTTNLWTRCQTFYPRRWSPIVYLMNFPRRVLYEWPDTYLNKQWSPQWSVFLQKLIIFTATTRCRPERLLWPSVPGWPGLSINQCGPGAQPTVTTWTSRGSHHLLWDHINITHNTIMGVKIGDFDLDTSNISPADVENLRRMLPEELQEPGKLTQLEIIIEAIHYIQMLQTKLKVEMKEGMKEGMKQTSWEYIPMPWSRKYMQFCTFVV